MKIYLLTSNKSGKVFPYRTLTALFEGHTREELGVSKSTLDHWTWDASTDWKYKNDLIEIKQSYLKGMKEVMLAKLAERIFEEGISVSVKSQGIVSANGYLFTYRKGFMLEDKSKKFADMEAVISFLNSN